MSELFKFELGEVLKDKVSGFTGVVMARTQYFTDCAHYGLCSQSLHDGKPIEWEWLDETVLMQIKGKKKILREPQRPTSGPFPNAPSM